MHLKWRLGIGNGIYHQQLVLPCILSCSDLRGKLECVGEGALNVVFSSADMYLNQSFNIIFIETEKTSWSIYKVSAFPETSQFWAAHVGLQAGVRWCKSRTSCLGCEGYWPRCNPNSSRQLYGRYAMFLTRICGCSFLMWSLLRIILSWGNCALSPGGTVTMLHKMLMEQLITENLKFFWVRT